MIPSVYGASHVYDFTQALALQPKMASVYNYLGLYLLLEEDYDSALETFNAVLNWIQVMTIPTLIVV